MDDILRRLEMELKKLLESQNLLKRSNADLHHRTEKLSEEKQALLNKQHQVVNQIKSLIVKLKALERLP